MDASDYKGKTGLRRLFNATIYSGQGLRYAWTNEAAFRQEVTGALVLIPFALWIDVSAVERILLLASVVLVMVVELLNTAVEAAIDRIGSERHELSGSAKDLGSAAVLLTLLMSIFCWVTILWQKIPF